MAKQVTGPQSPQDSASHQRIGVLMSDVKEEKFEWLSFGRIPYAAVSLLEGDPGLGKTFFYTFVAARLSVGVNLEGVQIDPVNSIILNLEDSPGATILPRLKGEGADLERIQLITTVPGNRPQERKMPCFPDDLHFLEREIESFGAGLVVIDPLFNYLPEGVSSGKDEEIRRVLMPIAALAERSRVAILIVRHLSKNTSSVALYRGSGSVGIVGVARVAMMVLRDPDQESCRLLCVHKNNISKIPDSVRFTIVQDLTRDYPYLSILGTSTYTAEKALRARQEKEEEQVDDHVEAFLWSALKAGPRPVDDVRKASVAEDIRSGDLAKVRKALGVEIYKEGFGTAGRWWWRWPEIDRRARLELESPVVPDKTAKYN